MLHLLFVVDTHPLRRSERMEPPIQTEHLRSGGTLNSWAKAASSLVMRSPMPANMVVPPESTMPAWRSLRMSKARRCSSRASCTPETSLELTWNTSGVRPAVEAHDGERQRVAFVDRHGVHCPHARQQRFPRDHANGAKVPSSAAADGRAGARPVRHRIESSRVLLTAGRRDDIAAVSGTHGRWAPCVILYL